ncbi:hypothetical protein AV530_002855 [Patagioenas fasciata monilis]|uniref:Uncharacterized protein n=1 Tax=Patagioenas fasciata monilis TaxID=372326 RepID=A0A1V4K9F8_PATFA|nr:hypothetical protein AV530_002855 [Patagioenas fasciata monilis]
MCVLIWRKKINHTEASPSLQVHFLQIICKFSIMAIHSFCHLEEPVPQNNDLKKAHLFARKSLHLGNSTGAAKMCFVRFRSLTFSGMRISEQTDYWGLPSYSSGTVLAYLTALHTTKGSYWNTARSRCKTGLEFQSYLSLVSVIWRQMSTHSSKMRERVLKSPNSATEFVQTDPDSHGA